MSNLIDIDIESMNAFLTTQNELVQKFDNLMINHNEKLTKNAKLKKSIAILQIENSYYKSLINNTSELVLAKHIYKNNQQCTTEESINLNLDEKILNEDTENFLSGSIGKNHK